MRSITAVSCALFVVLGARAAWAQEVECPPKLGWSSPELHRATVFSYGKDTWKETPKHVRRVLHQYPLGGYLVEGTQEQLDALVPLGMDVESQDEARFAETPAGLVDAQRAPGVGHEAKPPTGWEPLAGPGGRVWWVVQAAGFPEENWPIRLNLLEEGHIESLGWSGRSSTMMIRATEAQAKGIAKRPGIQWVGRYQPLYKASLSLTLSSNDPIPCRVFPNVQAIQQAASVAGTDAASREQRVSLQVVLFPGSRVRAVMEVAKAAGGKIDLAQSTAELLTLEGPRSIIRALARHEDVREIDEASVASIDG